MIGDLKIMVLMELARHPSSGYQLMTTIQRVTGSRPSPGSIYPLLRNLKIKGYVTVRQEGKKNLYSLTSQGRKRIVEIKKHKNALLTKLQSSIVVFEALCGKKEAQLMKEFLLASKEGEEPLLQVRTELIALKHIMFSLWKSHKLEQHQSQIKTILKTTVRQLENFR